MTPRIRHYTRRKHAAGRHRQRWWQAMRIMRTFTVTEVMAACEYEGSCRSVHAYLSVLRRTGYVTRTPEAAPYQYRLIRDSGPHCPSVIHRGKVVFDHNTDTEYPL